MTTAACESTPILVHPMQATFRLLTVLFVLTATATFLSACAPPAGAPTASPGAGDTAGRATPAPSLTPIPTRPFVEIEQSDMPPMAPTIVGLSKGLDAARANGTWVPVYPATMDALSLQESGLDPTQPNTGAYRLQADVQGRIDIHNPYRGGTVDWTMIRAVTRPFAIDPNHSYAGQESIAVLPSRYLERTSDQRLLQISAAQLRLGNRIDIWFWFKGNAPGNFTFVNITVVLIDAP